MAALLEHFGQLKKIIEQRNYISIHGHPNGLEYELVKSIIWVDVGLPKKVPHQYRSWYRQDCNGLKEGPIPEYEIPLYVMEVAFGNGTTDPRGGSVVDPMDPGLEDPESPVYSTVGSSWSVEGDDEEDEDP